MKIIKFASLAATVAAVALAATPANAAGTNTDSDTATAHARILSGIDITKTSDLSFGDIVVDRSATFTGSTVSINNSNGAVSTCGANLTCSGTTTAAKFTVVSSDSSVSVDVPDSVDIVSAAGDTLTVGLVHNADTGGTGALASTGTVSYTAAGNASAATAYEFYVGGNFGVDSTTPDGYYTGDFDVTATYE